jgi:hypothetical protein
VVIRRPGPARLDDRSDGHVALVVSDRQIVFPGRIRPALENVLSRHGPWVLGDLAEVLDEPSRAVFGRRLLREGVLRRDG